MKRHTLFTFLSLVFAHLTMSILPLFSQSLDDAFKYSLSGVGAQKIRLTLIAQNMANLTTLEDENTGLPWQKRYAVLTPGENGVRVVSVEKSNKPFGKYYDPAVPQSSVDGFVSFPNVNIPDEMVNLAYTEVIFDANITSFRSTKALYQSFIDAMK
jgi:flagellar basal-body rod protein FlgC